MRFFHKGDVVVIVKPLCDMSSYGVRDNTTKNLRVGSVGVVMDDSADDKSDVYIDFESNNPDGGKWFCDPRCLDLVRDNKNKYRGSGVTATINCTKGKYDADDVGVPTIHRLNQVLATCDMPTLNLKDKVVVLDIQAKSGWTSFYKTDIAKVKVKPLYCDVEYWIDARQIDYDLTEEDKGLPYPETKVTGADGVQVKTDCGAPKEEEIPTPIKALKKATTFSIGQSIQFIPDDSTEVFMGIIEAYVVTKKQIFLQTTNGDLVLPSRVLKKGETK